MLFTWKLACEACVSVSSILSLDQPNYYAYLYFKGKHFSILHETWQTVCYRYGIKFWSRDLKTTYNGSNLYSKWGTESNIPSILFVAYSMTHSKGFIIPPFNDVHKKINSNCQLRKIRHVT